MTRKKTPNVLGDLMGEVEPTERRQTAKPSKQQDVKAANRQTVKSLGQRLASDKTKETLYLSPDTSYELEAAKLELRRLVDPGNLKDVTKSSIAEAAIILALRDLEQAGGDSAIAKELAKAVRR